MELSYNINPENAGVNAKLCDYGVQEVSLLTGRNSVGTSNTIDVSGKAFAHITLSGEFDADIRFYGYFTYESGDYESIKPIDHKGAYCKTKINEAGGYFVDLSKYAFFLIRVDGYRSGEINATGRFYTKPNDLFTRKRNVQLAYAHGCSVEGGKYSAVIDGTDVSEYPFQYVAVKADASHNFRVSLYYTPFNVGSLKNPIGDLFALNIENNTRGVSDWIEVKGNVVAVYIYNDSGETHSYDVYLNGVR